MHSFLIGGRRFWEPWISFIFLPHLLGKGRYRGAPGGLGEVQSNLAGQIGGE